MLWYTLAERRNVSPIREARVSEMPAATSLGPLIGSQSPPPGTNKPRRAMAVRPSNNSMSLAEPPQPLAAGAGRASAHRAQGQVAGRSRALMITLPSTCTSRILGPRGTCLEADRCPQGIGGARLLTLQCLDWPRSSLTQTFQIMATPRGSRVERGISRAGRFFGQAMHTTLRRELALMGCPG
jgi:hypothetical protein